MTRIRFPRLPALVLAALAQGALAQSATIVYKCPGNVYTSDRELTAKQAADLGPWSRTVTATDATSSSAFGMRSPLSKRACDHAKSASTSSQGMGVQRLFHSTPWRWLPLLASVAPASPI